MGVMHTMRAVTSGVPGLSVVGTDLSDERLENLTKVVGPTADKNGVPLDIINTASTPLEYGYTYATCLVPVPALVSQAVDLLAQGGILNVFAGIPAGTFGDFDLQGIIERQIFMLGTSGSDVSDMRTVLRKIEDGIIDTTDLPVGGHRHGGLRRRHQLGHQPHVGRQDHGLPDDARPGPDPRVRARREAADGRREA